MNKKNNALENYYNDFYKELAKIDAKGNFFNKIKDFLPEIKEAMRFLDIGCGYGSVTEELIKKGLIGYGIELNDDAITALQEKGFNVIKHDINKPFEIKEKFDLVFLLDILEHTFDPLFLLTEAKKILKNDGFIIVSIPLYFDWIDRLKILFTGRVISLDNLCYGKKNYKKFRSYNYDHIRFFRPKEILEMGEILNLRVDKIQYIPTSYAGNNKFIKLLVKIISNKYTVHLNHNLLAHSIKIRWKQN